MRFRLNVAHRHGRIEYEDIGSEVSRIRIRRTGSRGPRGWYRRGAWLAPENRGPLLLRTADHEVIDMEIYSMSQWLGGKGLPLLQPQRLFVLGDVVAI